MSPPPDAPSAAPADPTRWFQEEVHPHGGQLRSYLRKTYPSVRDVEDVVQESYLRIWKARAREPINSAKAFLFTIARRLALDHIRRDRRSPFLPVKDVNELFVHDKAPDAGATANTSLEIELMVEAVDSLPSRCREIFMLTHLEGLPHREVAARLGLAEGTVGVQSARGLKRCEEFVRQRLSPR